MTILWENQRNGDLCAGAAAHRRSLGFARDDKGESSDFYQGLSDRMDKNSIKSQALRMTILWENRKRNSGREAGL
jgi:hypothetical protein